MCTAMHACMLSHTHVSVTFSDTCSSTCSELYMVRVTHVCSITHISSHCMCVQTCTQMFSHSRAQNCTHSESHVFRVPSTLDMGPSGSMLGAHVLDRNVELPTNGHLNLAAALGGGVEATFGGHRGRVLNSGSGSSSTQALEEALSIQASPPTPTAAFGGSEAGGGRLRKQELVTQNELLKQQVGGWGGVSAVVVSIESIQVAPPSRKVLVPSAHVTA